MQENNYEIIVLKPTPVFLSFLAAHLPEKKLPDLRLLQIDNTSYVIPKKNTNEETVEEIEKHFQFIFNYEIQRWLGHQVNQNVDISFLDFLCCFRFEMHNHIILKENTISEGRQLLIFRPRPGLLSWLHEQILQHDSMYNVASQIKLRNIQENATAIVKNFPNLTSIKPFIATGYYGIFSAAMNRFSNHSNQWPLINSAQEFSQYFAVEIHTQLIHLS